MHNNETSKKERCVNNNLDEIISCIKKYAEGDFTEKITIVKEAGEFQELAANLNLMIEKVYGIIEEKQGAIKKRDEYKEELNQYKNHLGYKVALKTERFEKELIERRRREEKLIESEAKLKEALALAALGHWTFDLNQNRLYLSDEIYQIFEIDPSQFDGSFDILIDFIHPDDKRPFYNSYIDSVKNGKTGGLDLKIVLENQRIKFVHIEFKTYYDSHGKTLHSFGTVQDITERT